MSSILKKYFWPVFSPILLTAGITFFGLKVNAMITEKLQGAVTLVQFQDYIKNHQEWSYQVIKRLDEAGERSKQADEGLRQDMRDLSMEVRELRMEMAKRPPPPRFQAPKQSDIP